MGKFLDKFRPGDYLRELSVVILGVAVNFAGSAMITNHTVRKNIKENMRLIKIELEKKEELYQLNTQYIVVKLV